MDNLSGQLSDMLFFTGSTITSDSRDRSLLVVSELLYGSGVGSTSLRLYFLCSSINVTIVSGVSSSDVFYAHSLGTEDLRDLSSGSVLRSREVSGIDFLTRDEGFVSIILWSIYRSYKVSITGPISGSSSDVDLTTSKRTGRDMYSRGAI